MSEGLKLNIGAGYNKLEGFINIDIDPETKPDLVHDFTKRLPYENGSCDLIVMYHTIEHIQKKKHGVILMEIWRLLSPEGEVIITFPEFTQCVENWKLNYRGLKEFWEATIFGRQASSSDFHVCIMDSNEFKRLLIDVGFEVTKIVPEEKELWNTIIKAKRHSMHSYEIDVQDAVWG
jgi:predicted SAM-dependent methyltransferase